jgi:aspartate aminotransferase
VSPSNPTGAVYPREEIEAIGRWAVEHGMWVLTDEIYEHLVYGGAEHHSMPVVVPELADRCLVVNGVAKTYAMTGWRVGWLIGPTDAITAATNIQSTRPPTWPTCPSAPRWPPCRAGSRTWP